jgi:cytidine deaminase
VEAVAQLSDEELIATAAAVLRPRSVGGPLRDQRFGYVASALVTYAGNVYTGVSIDTGSGTGLCAEASAIAAVITAGENRIAKIVAVWRDEHSVLQVLPPCGRCREFIRQVDTTNLTTEVLLGPNRSVALTELLPEHEWPHR